MLAHPAQCIPNGVIIKIFNLMMTINSVLFYVLLIIFRKFIFLLMTKMEQNLQSSSNF